METYTRPKQTKSFPQGGEVQNGDTGNHQDIPPTRGVGNLSRLQGCLLPYTNTGTVQEISQISCPGSDLPVQSTAFWSVHSAHGVHCLGKGGETDGRTQGYKDPPVPRRLVGQSQNPPNLSPSYPDPDQDVPGSRLAREFRKIRTGAPTSIQLRRLPVRPQVWLGQTDTGPVAESSRENTNTTFATGLSGLAVHVLDRSINGHRETSSPRPPTHETHTVASQKQLEGTGIPRKGYPSTQIPAPTFTVVAKRKQCASRSTITPYTACSANFYRRIKRRVGRSFKRVHCKRVLVSAGKQAAHKLSGTKSSPLGLKRVPKPMHKQNCPSGHRQYYSSGLYKQGRGNEVGPTVCSTVENLDLVFPATSDPKSPTYPWPIKCDSRQAIQAKSDHPNRMVPPSGHLSRLVQKMAPATDRPICHEVQQQATSIRVSSTGHSGSSSGRARPTLGGSGCIRLPTDRHIGQSGGEVTGLPVQETHSDCPGVAQHALVLGLSDHVQSGPSQPAQPTQPADTALQSDPSQKSDKSKSPCLAPLCALLWRILTWCSQRQVTLKARHIPGRLNVIADKLSRLNQTIQTEWSLLPDIFQDLCRKWHRPQIDLFATRFNNKLPRFVSPVPDTLAVAVDALTLHWEDLDAYAFPPTAILGKVVEKLQDSPCKRLILIAPGWPNMPWFWDLVTMSSQVPLSLPNQPNLLIQPFSQIPHRNLTNLNLHAWLHCVLYCGES